MKSKIVQTSLNIQIGWVKSLFFYGNVLQERKIDARLAKYMRYFFMNQYMDTIDFRSYLNFYVNFYYKIVY